MPPDTAAFLPLSAHRAQVAGHPTVEPRQPPFQSEYSFTPRRFFMESIFWYPLVFLWSRQGITPPDLVIQLLSPVELVRYPTQGLLSLPRPPPHYPYLGEKLAPHPVALSPTSLQLSRGFPPTPHNQLPPHALLLSGILSRGTSGKLS